MSKHTKRRAKPAKGSPVPIVITCDEAAYIERCLMSAKSYVDRMIVLDTSSIDDIVAITKTCGAQVHHFMWVDNFSAARNATLATANADWNPVLNADERVETSMEELRNVRTSGPLPGVVYIHSEYDISGHVEYSNNWTARLLPCGVRHRGRIHEQPVATMANLQRVRLPFVIGHDGYMNAKLDRKRRRDRTLLQLELATHPDDPYVPYQFSKDFEINQKNPTEAAAHYQWVLIRAPRVAPHRHGLCICLLACPSKSKQFSSAITLTGEWMEERSGSPDYFYILGYLMFEAAAQDPAQAKKQWLSIAENAFLKYLEIGEQLKLDAAIFGCGSLAAAKYLTLTYRVLVDALAIKSNQYSDIARQMRERSVAVAA